MPDDSLPARFTDGEGNFNLPEIARALAVREELPPALVANVELAEALLDYQVATVAVLDDKVLDERRRDVIGYIRRKARDAGLVPNRGSESTPPVCAIVIGQTGAGKSSVIAKRVAEHLHAWVIDADEIKQQLPEYWDGYGNQAVHRESTEIRKQLELRIQMDQESYVHQMIGKDEASLQELIELNHELGYRVWLYLVNVTVDVAVSRSLTRFRGGSQGYIPPSETEKIGDLPLTNYNLTKNYADGYARIDNSDDKPKCVEVHNAWVPEPI